MSAPRPDWSGDELLKPWRRGRVELPFATSERSEAETQARIFKIAGLTALVIMAAVFGVFVWAGLFPEIYRHPNVTSTGVRGPLDLIGIMLGCGVVGALLLLGFLLPFLTEVPPGSGRPRSFEADAEGFRITNSRGETFAGPWSAWTLAGYDVMILPKAGPALSVLHLGLNGEEHPVRLMDLRHQRAFLRVVAQKMAV